jgi:hypothetical protein
MTQPKERATRPAPNEVELPTNDIRLHHLRVHLQEAKRLADLLCLELELPEV